MNRMQVVLDTPLSDNARDKLVQLLNCGEIAVSLAAESPISNHLMSHPDMPPPTSSGVSTVKGTREEIDREIDSQVRRAMEARMMNPGSTPN